MIVCVERSWSIETSFPYQTRNCQPSVGRTFKLLIHAFVLSLILRKTFIKTSVNPHQNKWPISTVCSSTKSVWPGVHYQVNKLPADPASPLFQLLYFVKKKKRIKIVALSQCFESVCKISYPYWYYINYSRATWLETNIDPVCDKCNCKSYCRIFQIWSVFFQAINLSFSYDSIWLSGQTSSTSCPTTNNFLLSRVHICLNSNLQSICLRTMNFSFLTLLLSYY